MSDDDATCWEQADEEILTTTLSDEALEVAAGGPGRIWTDPYHCHVTRGGIQYGCH